MAVQEHIWIADQLDIPPFRSTDIRRAVMLDGTIPESVPTKAGEVLRSHGAYGLIPRERRWITLYRPGYSGSAKRRRDALRLATYGSDTWRTAFKWGGRTIPYDQALQLYEDAYLAHFERDPEVLRWLLETARDVYDNSESNVLSGLDYSIQEAPTTHLQDIAVRRCVMRLTGVPPIWVVSDW